MSLKDLTTTEMCLKDLMTTEMYLIRTVFVISNLLKRHVKVKHRAQVYSRAL